MKVSPFLYSLSWEKKAFALSCNLFGSLSLYSQFLCGVREGEVFKRKGFEGAHELTMVTSITVRILTVVSS